MSRVSPADQVLLLLRERLQKLERSRAGRSAPAGRAATSRPLDRLQRIAALDRLTEDELRRTMVRALLTEELGEAVASDPTFQAVVDDVLRIIAESAEGERLLAGAAEQLKAG
jgi:hypothetical protein